MKKFAVYSKVRLVKFPSWLNKFQKEHLKEDWHVTLKQTCWIEDDQVSDIKNKLKELHKELKFKGGKIDINFDKLVIDKEKEGGGKTIMVRAIDNKPINLLQKKIIKILKDYNNYDVQESGIWERNFKPHLTLASNLKEKDFLKAESYIKDYACEGVIDSITFIYLDKNNNKTRINYKFL
jgi:2'-5' RNA ligase